MKEKTTTVLITGATGGIGRALSREFARRGADLILTGRSSRRLEELAARLRKLYGVQVLAIPADLEDPSVPGRIHSQLGMASIQVDVLVNNAGFGLGGPFAENNPPTQESMMAVNMAAPTRMCRLFLPDMLERGRGAVLNIASTGSFVPGPMNAMYCATKAYLLSLSQALWWETRDTGVHVTAVCPGGTHTGFAHRANMEATRLFHYGVLTPGQVARQAVRALYAGKAVSVVGGANRGMIFATRLVPRSLSTAASALLQQPGAFRKVL